MFFFNIITHKFPFNKGVWLIFLYFFTKIAKTIVKKEKNIYNEYVRLCHFCICAKGR